MEVNTFSAQAAVFDQTSSASQAEKPAAKQTANAQSNYQGQAKIDKPDPQLFPQNGVNNQKNAYKDEQKSQMEVLERAIADANKQLHGLDREFNYSVHEVTKDIMIKIVDSSTKEVVREIPPKKVLDAIAKMWELTGIIVDEKM